ncbi:MAG: hypothetical protein AAB365_00510 [Patescibacteria group bacterium]
MAKEIKGARIRPSSTASDILGGYKVGELPPKFAELAASQERRENAQSSSSRPSTQRVRAH